MQPFQEEKRRPENHKTSARIWGCLHGLKWFAFWFLTSKIALMWMAYNDRETPVNLFLDSQLKVSYNSFNKYDDMSGCHSRGLRVEIMGENVTFLKTPAACKDDERVVMVLSHPKGISERRNIRQQIWEFNNNTKMEIRLRPLFLVGTANESNVDLEFAKYGDILQISALEGYGRISYKTAAGFVWGSCFCANVNYLIKIDDDVTARYDYIMNILEHNFRDVQSLTVQCPSVMRNMRPWRPRKSGSNTFMGKWSVKTYEMARRVYPSFCPGWLYATTPKMAIRLAEMASNLDTRAQALNRLDDIYMTGFALERVPGAKLQQFHSDGKMGELWNEEISYCPCVGILKMLFYNPFVESKTKYANKGWVIWCAFYEYFILDNLEFLIPELLPNFVTGLCNR